MSEKKDYKKDNQEPKKDIKPTPRLIKIECRHEYPSPQKVIKVGKHKITYFLNPFTVTEKELKEIQVLKNIFFK